MSYCAGELSPLALVELPEFTTGGRAALPVCEPSKDEHTGGGEGGGTLRVVCVWVGMEKERERGLNTGTGSCKKFALQIYM